MTIECNEERLREILSSSRRRIAASRAMNRDLQESVNSSKKAILASYRVLQRNKGIADGLSYYAEACRTFHITPPQPE